MEDKTQYEIFREEFLKATDALRDAITDFGERLSKLLPDIEIPDEEEEDTWEMKCPFEDGNEIWVLNKFGDAQRHRWDRSAWLDYTFNQGNIFPTEEAAELEAKRRNLLTRFRAFRDECNGNWNPDWKSHRDRKYFISFSEKIKLLLFYTGTSNHFQLFGFFKNEEDAQRAIELFGKEIIELFVDCEG